MRVVVLAIIGALFQSCLIAGSVDPTADVTAVSVGVRDDGYTSFISVTFTVENTSGAAIYGSTISFEFDTDRQSYATTVVSDLHIAPNRSVFVSKDVALFEFDEEPPVLESISISDAFFW